MGKDRVLVQMHLIIRVLVLSTTKLAKDLELGELPEATEGQRGSLQVRQFTLLEEDSFHQTGRPPPDYPRDTTHILSKNPSSC